MVRRWVAAVALTAAALTGCGTGTGTRTGDIERGPSAASGAPHAPAASSTAAAPLDCKRPAKEQVTGAPVVPTGAVAVRLCGGLVDNAGFNLTWPADTLRGGRVDELVEHLNTLERYVQPSACTLLLSPGFDLVLAYPDRRRVWLTGDTSGSCAHVTVQGGRDWRGAGPVLHRVLALIEAQRTAAGAATQAGAPCPRAWNAVSYTAGAAPVRPGAAVTVTVCRYRLEPVAPDRITQSADGHLVRQVRADDPDPLVSAIRRGSETDPCRGVAYDLTRIQDVLLVRDRYGDIHTVSTTPCWADDMTGHRRYPSRQLRVLVGRLLT